ncbi:unnamed protein product [Caenorhabditis bovis]|uniref:Yippee domain-containing protein n=1 Tax=Caenorhabditis bovis TaxID=2654633 RepID=A0A8S1F8C6_9PELO|nr:unnamed protein product [Caenorhabditis bovis]
MGIKFLENIPGTFSYHCVTCGVFLSPVEEVLSDNFTGVTGPAMLFKSAKNLRYGACDKREMLTGLHYVRDIFCLNCDVKLGWMYEMALVDTERYKEGAVILEKKLICKHDDHNCTIKQEEDDDDGRDPRVRNRQHRFLPEHMVFRQAPQIRLPRANVDDPERVREHMNEARVREHEAMMNLHDMRPERDEMIIEEMHEHPAIDFNDNRGDAEFALRDEYAPLVLLAVQRDAEAMRRVMGRTNEYIRTMQRQEDYAAAMRESRRGLDFDEDEEPW